MLNIFSQKPKQTADQSPIASQPPLPEPTVVKLEMPVAPSEQPAFTGVPSPTGIPTQQNSTTPTVAKQEVTILSHLDQRAQQALASAKDEAVRIKQESIQPEQILIGLLQDSDIKTLVEQFSLQSADIIREVSVQEPMGTFVGQPKLSDASIQLVEQAYTLAKERHLDFVMPEDLFMAILSNNITAATVLSSQGMQKEKVQEKLKQNPKYAYGSKSLLAQFGTDLTKLAEDKKLDPVVGRDTEIDRVMHILLRRIKNNPIVIGEAGVGKTAIIEGLAQLIVAGKIPADLKNKRIIQLDVASLLAGAAHRGEFEERLRNIIKEAQMSGGKIILFIDEIHTLIGAGQTEGAMDASNIIKPFLARGQFQLIGSTTTSEYRRYFEKDKAFARRFQDVMVEEPSEETAVQMLQILKPKYEEFHNILISDEAITAAVKLSKRYIGDRFLPDKAIDLLDEAATEVRLSHAENRRPDNIMNRADIELIVSKWTGIPITKLTEDESQKLLKLEDLIHKRLINQASAVGSIAEAVRRGRIGLSSMSRPIASFIFLGPTGVGKTELAKTLAEILFGKEEAMIRIDMSEYMEKHEVAKLIGAPPGYVGYEEGGQLTEAVRSKPYSVVLLDEIEKAHPDVFNILLQLLEDGRLTDNKGNTVSFKNTIVIATSNIGSSLIQDELQKKEHLTPASLKEFKKIVEDELHKFFRPELINRFDEVIIFEPLTRDHMVEVANLQIQKTRKLLADQQVGLTVTDAAMAELSKEGYDPVYGARPLRRLIQSVIENPIARLLIEKKFGADETVFVDYDAVSTNFTFKTSAEQPVTPGEAQFPEVSQLAQPPIQEVPESTPELPAEPLEPVAQEVTTQPEEPNAPTEPVSDPAVPQTEEVLSAVSNQPVIPPTAPIDTAALIPPLEPIAPVSTPLTTPTANVTADGTEREAQSTPPVTQTI